MLLGMDLVISPVMAARKWIGFSLAGQEVSGYHEMDNPNQGQDDMLTAEQAKTEGLVQARIAGLVGEPTSEFTKLTDLEEYTDTSAEGSGELGSDRSPLAGSEGWP